MGERIMKFASGNLTGPAGSVLTNPPVVHSSAMKKESGRLIVVVLALITANLVIYLPTINYPFINLDDPLYVSRNPHIADGLTWHGISWAFATGRAGHWHPLTWLSHMLDIQVFGIVAGPQHLVNLLLHIGSSILLFVVLFRMTKAFGSSAFAAAVFATHPLRVESVAWVAERKDVLSTFLWMLTLLTYVAYVQRPSTSRRLILYGVFALGLMAKSMLVTLPIVLLILDVWPLQRIANIAKWADWRPLVFEKIPMFALVIVSAAITIVMAQESTAVSGLDVLPPGVRLANAIASYGFYLVKLAWPRGLAPFYIYASPPFWWIAVSSAALCGATWCAWRACRSRPYLMGGWLWYLVTLLPVIGLIQNGPQARADRYTYIPTIGILIVIAWGLPDLLRRWKYRNLVLALAAGIVFCACTIAARAQVQYWRSDSALWEHTLDVTDNNYMAHINLGLALADQGRVPEAIVQYNDAIQIGEGLQFKPNLGVAHNGLGLALSAQGHTVEAVEQYRTAILLNPALAEPHNNLGITLTGQGKLDDAIAEFEKALRIAPENASIQANLNVVLAEKERSAEAIQRYSEALRLQPNDAEGYNKLGLIQANQGDYNHAIANYNEALRINPRSTSALRNMGVALANLGRIDEAIEHFNKSLKIDPNDAEAYSDMGTAFVNLGKDAEAIACYVKALRINPDFVDAHYNLGVELENLGKKDEALREYSEVLRLNPNYSAARDAIHELGTPVRGPQKQ